MLLKRLAKLATKLDSLGLKSSADLVDLLTKRAIEEWQYYGYPSPEDYEEKVKSIREYKEIPPEEVAPEEVKQVDQPDLPPKTMKDISLTDNLDPVAKVAAGYYGAGTLVGATKFEIVRKGAKVVLVFREGQDAKRFVEEVGELPGFSHIAGGHTFILNKTPDELEVWVSHNKRVPTEVDLQAYANDTAGEEEMQSVLDYMKKFLPKV